MIINLHVIGKNLKIKKSKFHLFLHIITFIGIIYFRIQDLIDEIQNRSLFV